MQMHKRKTKALSLLLALIMALTLLPTASFAASIGDGSKTCTVTKNARHTFLTTTVGTRLGATAYNYTTNDGLNGPAYCIDHGLNHASGTLTITGMYIRTAPDSLGGNISIPADMTLEFAADNGQYGIKREVIGGVSYYTIEYIFASATSTYYSGYNIELWADGAPSGAIFTDLDNNELPRGSFRDTKTWTLPVKRQSTTLNSNGYEYVGAAKLCIPVETAPNSGEITIRCGAYAMQYEIYMAKNSVNYEQSYIIADPSKGTQQANAVLNWGSELTETGRLLQGL